MSKEPEGNLPAGEDAANPAAGLGPDQAQVPGGTAAPAREDPYGELFAMEPSTATDEDLNKAVNRLVARQVGERAIFQNYNVLFLYDSGTIVRWDSNRIYQALSGADQQRPILLVLRSPGGDVAAAYFIGKLCREHTTADFEVAVPREAKSAATLICCGADTVHMGSLSELGPIDPQFGGMPALAVKHSLEHLAEIVTRHPGAKEMVSDYLFKALPVNLIGHFERAAGSAAQYAERLLQSRRRALSSAQNAEIARKLVYDYKDHGFAIDAREATSIFGPDMIRTNSELYTEVNDVYDELDFIGWILDRRFNREFAFTGGPTTGSFVTLKRPKTTPA